MKKERDNSAIEAEIKRMFDEADGDYSEIENFISSYEDPDSADAAEIAFRIAIQNGETDYVKEHVGDFDLNDGGGYSTYLDETEDEDTQEILTSHGAFRSWDDYGDCRFAMETANGGILAFDQDLQEEVFEALKEEYDLTDERIMEILANSSDDEGEGDDLDDDDLEILECLEALGVSYDDGELGFDDLLGDDGYGLKELLEDFGWRCEFEGESWSLETNGVYFIK